jgi:hypothetical protein
MANCLQQRFAIAMLHTKYLPQVQILYCGVRGAGCGVRGYLLHPLLHTPHSLTLYSALLKIVLPYQHDNNIFKILCQHLKIKFFAVFFALIVALWGDV